MDSPAQESALAIVELALSQTILQYVFFYVGLSHATGVHGAIITGTNVFFPFCLPALFSVMRR